MGNTLGGQKTAKIMKIDGETIKLKTPIQVREVVKDYPGHVILDSDSVKHYGIRAKPLDVFQSLEPKKLYFLVELPGFPAQPGGSSSHHDHRVPRRVRSGIQMSAKDRLERLMLSRRSMSDLSIMGPATRVVVDGPHEGQETTRSSYRVKMRLPKAQVERLMSQSKEQKEAGQKISDLYMVKTGQPGPGRSRFSGAMGNGTCKGKEVADYKKRVGFLAIHEGEVAVVS